MSQTIILREICDACLNIISMVLIYLFKSAEEKLTVKIKRDEGMIDTIETILLILFAAAIGLFQNMNKPIEYKLNMEDGTNKHIVLQKNSSYACPLYCEVDHIHHAVIYNNNETIDNYELVYHISEESENGSAMYCSNKKILSMSKFIPKSVDEDLPDVVSASTEQ